MGSSATIYFHRHSNLGVEVLPYHSIGEEGSPSWQDDGKRQSPSGRLGLLQQMGHPPSRGIHDRGHKRRIGFKAPVSQRQTAREEAK